MKSTAATVAKTTATQQRFVLYAVHQHQYHQWASGGERKRALKSIKQGNLKIELMNGKRAKTAWHFYRCIECSTYSFNLFNLTLTRCILEQANESLLWLCSHSHSYSYAASISATIVNDQPNTFIYSRKCRMLNQRREKRECDGILFFFVISSSADISIRYD